MASIDLVVPSYRGINPESHDALVVMMRTTLCNCRDGRGFAAHEPWKCPAGKHSVRLLPAAKGASVVHWARNQAVALAMFGPQPEDGRPPAEYFLFMDDDMMPQPGNLLRLASHKKDIVCGICTTRRDPPRPTISNWLEGESRYNGVKEWAWDSQKLIEIDASGAAFMLVKRAVLERMMVAYMECEFEIAEDLRKYPWIKEDARVAQYWEDMRHARQERFTTAMEKKDWKGMDCWWFRFLDHETSKQVGEIGEDFAFCRRAKQLGFKIFADPQVLPGHIGWWGYSAADWKDYVESHRMQHGTAPVFDDHGDLIMQPPVETPAEVTA